MKEDKELIKANWFLTIAGIVVTVLFFVGSIANWEDCAELDFIFPKTISEQTSSYCSLSGKRELTSYQQQGNGKCKYNLAKRTRTSSAYKNVYTGVKYKKNNTCYNVYEVSFGAIKDTKFKMTKTAGTKKKSKVKVLVENI